MNAGDARRGRLHVVAVERRARKRRREGDGHRARAANRPHRQDHHVAAHGEIHAAVREAGADAAAEHGELLSWNAGDGERHGRAGRDGRGRGRERGLRLGGQRGETRGREGNGRGWDDPHRGLLRATAPGPRAFTLVSGRASSTISPPACGASARKTRRSPWRTAASGRSIPRKRMPGSCASRTRSGRTSRSTRRARTRRGGCSWPSTPAKPPRSKPPRKGAATAKPPKRGEEGDAGPLFQEDDETGESEDE